MNKTSTDRIERAAKFLRTPTAQAARGYLAGPLETALKILDCFADGKPHSYEELEEISGIHSNTIRAVLGALDRGGYGFTFTPAQGWKPTKVGGRPTVAAQPKKVVKQ